MKKLLGTLVAATAAGPALAHHPLAGAQMETFAHGALSGVGHPLLGFDHLFFVLLVGIAALYTGNRFSAPLGFILGMLGGTVLMSNGFALPMIETMIVVSLILLGAVVASGRALGFGVAFAAFAVAGIFHGSAYGVSIASQEMAVGGSVMVGYLLGLGVTQYLISIAAGFAALKIWNASEATATAPRLAGAFVAGIGVFLAMEQIEGAAFAALGLG